MPRIEAKDNCSGCAKDLGCTMLACSEGSVQGAHLMGNGVCPRMPNDIALLINNNQAMQHGFLPKANLSHHLRDSSRICMISIMHRNQNYFLFFISIIFFHVFRYIPF